MVVQTPENLLNGALKGKMGAAYTRWKKLEDERTSWEGHWRELSDYILPRRGRYLLENQSSKGRKRNTKIIDNTAGQSLRTLSAGMMSGLTSPARPWFRLMTPDEAMMDEEGVKDWLGKVEITLRRILSASNFYNTASVCYTELGAFGTHAMLRRAHPQKVINYRAFTAGEYVLAENDFNEVDTLGRNFTLTVGQVVRRFVWNPITEKEEWGRVSKATRTLWNNKNFDEQINIVHLIQPRSMQDRDLSRKDGKNREFADLYFEEGADKEMFLQEDGYDRFPVYAPRWDVLAGDVYGVGPGMETLGDVKQLQHQQKRKAQAIDKMVNPPMVATVSLKGKPTTVLPGGTTYVDPQQGGQGFAPAYQVQPRIQELAMDIQEVQERIQRGFYADLFAMMLNSDRRQMTATEVAERHEEKLVLLGPVLQRLNVELLDPLVEDAFMMAITAGMLPEPPQALQGIELSIKYISLLAQAQEAVAATGIERTMSMAGNLAGVFPDIIDNIDSDEALRQYSEIIGNGPELIRDQAEVDEIREQRAAQQKAQMEAEQAAQMAPALQQSAQAAKLMSETDTSSTQNALTDLLGAGGLTP